MKKLVSALFSVCLVVTLLATSVAFAKAKETEISVVVDGKKVAFPDGKPFKDAAGRIQVPNRFIGEALGADVEWGKADFRWGLETVTFTTEKANISFFVGNDSFDIFGGLYVMDTKTIKQDGRIYTPVRYVAEGLGALVKWDGKKNEVIITSGDGTSLIDYEHPNGSADYTEAELVKKFGNIAKGSGKKETSTAPSELPLDSKLDGKSIPTLPKDSTVKLMVRGEEDTDINYILKIDYSAKDIEQQLKDVKAALLQVFPEFAVEGILMKDIDFVSKHDQGNETVIPETNVGVLTIRPNDNVQHEENPPVYIIVLREGVTNFNQKFYEMTIE